MVLKQPIKVELLIPAGVSRKEVDRIKIGLIELISASNADIEMNWEIKRR